MQQAFVPHLPLRTASSAPAALPPKPSSLHPRRSRPLPIPSAAAHPTLRTDDAPGSSAPSTPQSPADWLRANEHTLHAARDRLRVGYCPPGSSPSPVPPDAPPRPTAAPASAPPASRPIPIPVASSSPPAASGRSPARHRAAARQSRCRFRPRDSAVASSPLAFAPSAAATSLAAAVAGSTATIAATATAVAEATTPSTSTISATIPLSSSPPDPSSSPSPSSPAGATSLPSPRAASRGIPAVLRVAASLSPAMPASPPSYCHVTPEVDHLIAQLRDRIHYLGPVTRNKVVRAVDLARAAGASPAALSYNIAVALVVADLQMDCDTVCAAVLRGLVAVRPIPPAPAPDSSPVAPSPSAVSSPTLSPSSSTASPSSSTSSASSSSSPAAARRAASAAAIPPPLPPPLHAEAVERDVGADVTRILRFHARVEESVNLCVDVSFTEMSFSNLRELILVGAMSEHRAISLELARAVLAMRSVDALPDAEARVCMARRSMYLYAPLANQLGIYFVQSELEELSFMYLQPANYHQVRELVGERRRECEHMLARSKDFLERILSTTPEVRSLVRTVQIKGRVKGLYSVYRKMRRSGKKVDQIYDLLALRVVVQPKKADDASEHAACYAVADMIRRHYVTLESRGKDYIADPKRNGYRSLHMTVLPQDGSTPLEIQIRSEKMHHVAEFGAAAHWIYKEKPDEEDAMLSDFDSDNDNDSDAELGFDDDDDEEGDDDEDSTGPRSISDYGEHDEFSPFSMEEDLSKPTVRSDISLGARAPPSLPAEVAPLLLRSPRSVQVKERVTHDEGDDAEGLVHTSLDSSAKRDEGYGQRATPASPAKTSPSSSSPSTKLSAAPAGATATGRRRRQRLASQFPRPRVAAAQGRRRGRGKTARPTAHEARMSELVSQRLSTRSSSQSAQLQDQLRGGYVACLASAIRASRVIVAVAGQVYGLAVGSTLLDLAHGLGVASLGAVAVVNGSVAPLTQRLEMNDIVWFVQA